MSQTNAVDVLILSNGPGELSTWVRPVVAALQSVPSLQLEIRISIILSPCPHATGREVEVAQAIPGVKRVQGAEFFFPFLLWGKTADNWNWHQQGIVLFLGGDQFFPVVIAKRLGYPVVIYAEWDTRWHSWVDHFVVMNADLISKAPQSYRHKFTIVGDIMADSQIALNAQPVGLTLDTETELIGILPGSKRAKLMQGVPLTIAIAQMIHEKRPQTQFIIPVAPTLDLETLAQYADSEQNSLVTKIGGISAKLVSPSLPEELPYLETETGLKILLWKKFPAYDVLSQCSFCLTTVGANTAELGALAIPMIVLLPTYQLDAMRAWDGLPGILANLPLLGGSFARLINWLVLRNRRLFAWPNIWAQEEVVPELVGNLEPEAVAQIALDWLEHPDKRRAIRSRLQAVRGKPGASKKIAAVLLEQLQRSNY
jgi:lipid-A-disaccharide synthase